MFYPLTVGIKCKMQSQYFKINLLNNNPLSLVPWPTGLVIKKVFTHNTYSFLQGQLFGLLFIVFIHKNMENIQEIKTFKYSFYSP